MNGLEKGSRAPAFTILPSPLSCDVSSHLTLHPLYLLYHDEPDKPFLSLGIFLEYFDTLCFDCLLSR